MPQYLDANGNPVQSSAKVYLDPNTGEPQHSAPPSAPTPGMMSQLNNWWENFTKPVTEIQPHQPIHSTADLEREAVRGVGNVGAGALGVLLHPLDTLAGMGTLALRANPVGGLVDMARGQPNVGQEMGAQLMQHPLTTIESGIGQAAALPVLEDAAKVPLKIIPKVARGAANIVAGTSPEVAEKLAEDTQTANTASQAKADQANAKIMSNRAKQLQQHFEQTQAVRAQNEAAESLQSRKAALSRGVEQLDPQFQSDLQATEKNVRAQAGANYDAVRSTLEPQPQPVQYVKNGPDLNLEATAAKLPPVPEGYTRLYRSESPTTKFEDVFDKSKLQDFNANRPEGKSYTDDLNSAAYYKQTYGPDAQTSYVDVPNAVAQKAKIGDGEYVIGDKATVPTQSLVDAVRKAEGLIEGSSENLKVFRDILSKAPEQEDVVFSGGQKFGPGTPLYESVKASPEGLPGASAPATFSDLQGYYTELGSQLSKGTLPSDVYLAMKDLQGSIGNLMQNMAESKGVGEQLMNARKFYSDYMSAFRDHGSPLYKAMNATERGKSIGALKGADQSGIQILARYNPELAQRANTIRGYQAEAKSIPSRTATPKPEPALPPSKPPVLADIKKIGLKDIQEAKQNAMLARKGPVGGKLGHLASGAGAWHVISSAMYGNPEGMLIGGAVSGIPYALSKVLKMPEVVRILSTPTPADIAAIPPEIRGDLPQIVKQAQKEGIAVHPAILSLAGATQRPQ